DGKDVATGGVDQTVRIWNSRHGGKPLRVVQSSGEVAQLAFSPKGGLLAAASAGVGTKVWKYKAKARPLTLHTSSVDSVAFSPDGRYLVTVGADTLTHVWDTHNGHEVGVLREHADEVTAVALSPNGRRILSGRADVPASVDECSACAPLDRVVRRPVTLLR